MIIADHENVYENPWNQLVNQLFDPAESYFSLYNALNLTLQNFGFGEAISPLVMKSFPHDNDFGSILVHILNHIDTPTLPVKYTLP